MGRRLLRDKKKPSILIRDPELRTQRREQVAAAAVDLFIRDGFHATGVREIAQQAGVSPGAVLTYFRDKEEILFYIFDKEQSKAEEHLAETLAQIRRTATPQTDPREIIEQVVDTLLNAIDGVSRFTLLAYQETKSLRQEWREELFARERRIQDLLMEAMSYGVRQGMFAPDHLRIQAHSITMLVHAWAVRRWALKEVASLEEYRAIIKPQILGLLSVRTGAGQKRARLPASQDTKRRVA